MPFNMMPNVAQYGGADWSNLVTRISGSTPQSAQRVAMSNPDITFFFYCREPMYLDGQGQFLPGDSVFFSGQPWPGSAPQCDIYQKDFFNIAYVEVNSNNFANVGCYTLADGRQFFDMASIFAANINAGQDGAVLYFNPQVSQVLNETDYVSQLQSLGISVLLTVLGNHENAGWSCFTSQSDAQQFAQQLADCVSKYGLDGIDIDDEYSSCTTNDTSLIMVTNAMRQLMPGKIISKALFSDIQYFNATWNGMTLAQQLSYGWEMYYGGGDCNSLLTPYVTAGMAKPQLGTGVSTTGTGASMTKTLTQCTKNNQYGGMMVYNVTSDSTAFLSIISQAMYGQDTVAKANCLT